MLSLPLFGIAAWLFAKPRLTALGSPHQLRNTLQPLKHQGQYSA